MARFDVYRNTGHHQATSPIWSMYKAIILTRSAQGSRFLCAVLMPVWLPEDLVPVFDIENIACILDAPQLAAIHSGELREKVASLEHQRERILAALDRLFGAF